MSAAALPSAPLPPPHDPTERELALVLGAWEVRIFTGRKLDYFVPRGLWHLQLWHPRAHVSVLTPSRLTSGRYEVFPVAGWKARAKTLHEVDAFVARSGGASLPEHADVARIERVLVGRIVRSIVRPGPFSSS